jgi:glutamate-1-semialdehyde 2,1-aminomutase
MATLFMSPTAVTNFAQASESDTERYGAYFRHMLDHGIYVPPSQFEAMFVSLAHGDEEIDRTVGAAAEFFAD